MGSQSRYQLRELAHWLLRLEEYDYEIQKLPGFQHQLGDEVSRQRAEGGHTDSVGNYVPCFTIQSQTRIDAPLNRLQRVNHDD